MPSTSESTGKQGAAQAQGAERVAAFSANMLSDLSHKGMEAFVEIQKLFLDMASFRNATALAVAKEACAIPNNIPALAEVAHQGVNSIFGAQKNILDLAIQQSAVATNALRENVEASSQKIRSVVNDSVKETSDRILAAQKAVQELAVKQSELALNMLKPFGFPAAAVNQSVAMVMEAQKDVVEAATRPLRSRAAGSE